MRNSKLFFVLATLGLLTLGSTQSWAPEPGMGSQNDRGSHSGPGHSGSSGHDTSQPAGHPSNPIGTCDGSCPGHYLHRPDDGKRPGRLYDGARGDTVDAGGRGGMHGPGGKQNDPYGGSSKDW